MKARRGSVVPGSVGLFLLCAALFAENVVIAIGRDDDTTFGILHSRFHEVWSLRRGTWLGKGNDPRYTPTTTFETFPFPDGLSPDISATDYATDPRAQAIASAARRRPWTSPARDSVAIAPASLFRSPRIIHEPPGRG